MFFDYSQEGNVVFCCHLRTNARFYVLQSLRLSIAYEQNLYNLAHFIDYQSHPHLAASGKAGLTKHRKLFELAS